ncbi:MAG: tetratricopeptide repeat protein [Candidatus Methylacidiphilales bacterium]
MTISGRCPLDQGARTPLHQLFPLPSLPLVCAVLAAMLLLHAGVATAHAQGRSRSIPVPENDTPVAPATRQPYVPPPPPRSTPAPASEPAAPDPLQPDEDPITERYYQALEQHKKGNFAEAMALAESVYKARPATKVSILMARVAMEQSDYINARLRVSQILAAEPTNKSALVLSGDIYLRQKEFIKARASYDLAIKNDKRERKDEADPDIILKLIYTALGQKDIATASQLHRYLDQQDQFKPNYYFGKAAIAYALGKPAAADAALESGRSVYDLTVFSDYLADYMRFYPTTIPIRQKKGPTASGAEDSGSGLGQPRGTAATEIGSAGNAPAPVSPTIPTPRRPTSPTAP